MYYKVKISSVEDCTQKASYYVKNTDSRINRESLEVFFKKATPYKVEVIALPPHITKLKKKYKVWYAMELEAFIRKLTFYTVKYREVEDWVTIATFYGMQPFNIDARFFKGVWYSFCDRPNYTCANIYGTLLACGIDECDIHYSKYHDIYVKDMKLSFSYDGHKHYHLRKLVGTHYELKQEILCR